MFEVSYHYCGYRGEVITIRDCNLCEKTEQCWHNVEYFNLISLGYSDPR